MLFVQLHNLCKLHNIFILYKLYIFVVMKQITVKLSEEAYQKLLEIQFQRKSAGVEPTALNKIAAELLEEKLK